MLKVTPAPMKLDTNNETAKKRVIGKRAHSVGAPLLRPKSPLLRKTVAERRCQSLSPLSDNKKSLDGLERRPITRPSTVSAPEAVNDSSLQEPEKDVVLPQCLVAKISRTISTKKREFMKLRKNLIPQQNMMLQQYAALKELETRSGNVPDESLGEVRVVAVQNWPAYDLLLLVRDDISISLNSEIGGPQILQQITSQLNRVPEDIVAIGAELMARRLDLLSILREKQRTERATYGTNSEWKTKQAELDQETENLQRMVTGTVENIKAKINFALDLAKVPWIDRETLIKKINRLQKDNLILQQKAEVTKKDDGVKKETELANANSMNDQALCEELSKERSAKEALKELVSTVESMLRVARARVATLERQLNETRAELETTRKKHKDLEQLVNRLALEHNETYRHRESSYDARSKRLLEATKTGEITIETLSKQRDALEMRVKELRDQGETAERLAKSREAELIARVDILTAKVAEQEKLKGTSENCIHELENKVKALEELSHVLRERSMKLVNMERKRCLEYVPSKENEPTDRETEIWKELQATREALTKAEQELKQIRTDKDNFLNSLSLIAQGDCSDGYRDQMATELLDREQKIIKLQHDIDELKKNEKLMEQSMTQYENQLASLRLEVTRMKNYDCYSKEVSFQDLNTELLELQMQVETLSREKTALVTAAASRALMLERHERAADLFARMTRARKDLEALIDGRSEPNLDEISHPDVSRSLTTMCASAADTWTALRAERARVLRLESAVVAQSIQLEREERVRTQLERRKSMLEREILRAQHSVSPHSSTFSKNHS